MIEVGCAIASIVVLCCAMVTRPSAARCPPAWHLNGVRPSGAFTCLRVPGGDPALDGAFGTRDGAVDLPGELRGRIYCTGGSHPIIILTDRESRTVGCQR